MENALDKISSNPHSASVYEALTSQLKSLGQYEVEVKKTSLHITHGRAFLGVHPRNNGLLINIVTDKPLTSERIKKTEQVSANRYHNEVSVADPNEINSQLVGWITQAYSLT
jgi:hypothetical protein